MYLIVSFKPLYVLYLKKKFNHINIIVIKILVVINITKE